MDLWQFDSNKNESNTSIAIEQFQRVCRTCLVEGDHRSIFEITYDEKSVSEILKLHIAIKIEEEDRFPHNICSNCLTELFQCYYFITKCRQSDDVLRRVVESKPKLDNEGSNVNFDSGDNVDLSISINTPTKRRVLRSRRLRKSRKSIQFEDAKVQGPPFKCKDCEEHYDTLESMQKHRREARHPKHREPRNHSCSVCSKTFTSSKLRQHMRAHTKEKPYKCKVCLQAFSMSGNLKRHTMTHTGERPHVCEICGKGFIQATTLQNHRKTHTKYERMGGDANSPHFVCSYCGRGFKRLARYNAHLKKHYLDGNSAENKKSLEPDETREHVCMICKRAYKTKHLLKAHQLTHGEKTFLCSDCGKGFVTKAALQSHLKVHTGEKPHTCNVCKKSFAHVGSFEAHMLIHTGQKPYNCNVCTKAFTQLSHLKYHLRTHSGERPYICSFCGKSFALKGNLTVHVRTHTGETPYVCPICEKGFYDSSSMKKHRRGHGDTDNIVTQSAQAPLMINTVNDMNINCVAINSLLV